MVQFIIFVMLSFRMRENHDLRYHLLEVKEYLLRKINNTISEKLLHDKSNTNS